MVILGLLILLVAVAAGAAVYLSAATLSGTYSFDILGAKVTTNPLGLVLASAVVVLVFWFGWGVLRAGMRRSARRRRTIRRRGRTELSSGRIPTGAPRPTWLRAIRCSRLSAARLC